VKDHSEVFVAFDTSKLRNAVAIAEGGRRGEVRFLGEIDNSPEATAKLVRKLAGKYQRVTFCYEAGPTGYGLYRQISRMGHTCLVVAPSLIPKRPGDRVKTNRRDALSLARQLRAGELTAVWVPDPRHEAMRDLTRARGAAVADLRSKRQQASGFLLRLGRHFAGKKTWTKAHMTWLASQKLEHAEQRIAFEEMLLAIRQAQERVARLEEAIRTAVPEWSLAQVVEALMAMRGIDMVAATAFLAEIGNLSRFQTPRELMGYLGLVPSEQSTGDTIRRGRSPRRATAGLAVCWWKAPGVTATRPEWERTSRQKLRQRRQRCVRSPGRRSTAFTAVIARSRAAASSKRSPSRPWPASLLASCGRSIANSQQPPWHASTACRMRDEAPTSR
jgi:transposase